MKQFEKRRINKLLYNLLVKELANTEATIKQEIEIIEVGINCYRFAVGLQKELFDQVLIDYRDMLKNEIIELEGILNVRCS